MNAILSFLGLCFLMVLVGVLTRIPIGPVRYQSAGPLMSKAERMLFRTLLLAVDEDQTVMSKVRMADVVVPQKRRSRAEWQTAFNKVSSKHFDFVVIAIVSAEVVTAIELDDASHQRRDRRDRDVFVDKVCQSAGVPLIRIRAGRGYSVQDIRQRLRTVPPRATV